MRSPERRDETTISIAVALLIFAGVVVAGVVIHVAIAALGLRDDSAAPLMTASVLAAAVVSGRYLIRQDRA